MPFQSQAQSRKCFAGGMPGVDCEEWASKTDYSSLPKKKKKLAKSADLKPNVELQPHQEEVVDSFQKHPRLLLYHGLGTGKTLSSLAAADSRDQPYIVSLPASLRDNFRKEVSKFTNDPQPEIRSYTELGLGRPFDQSAPTFILDEAHRLRNPATGAYQGAAAQAAKSPNLLLLTGSPVVNHPTDLASMISLLRNKPMSPTMFADRFIAEKPVYPPLWRRWLLGQKTPGVELSLKNEGELKRILDGHVSYVPSRNPEGVRVNEEDVHVPLSPEQQTINRSLLRKQAPNFLWKLRTGFPLSKEEAIRLSAFLTGLRQVSLSTTPFQRNKDPDKAFSQSPKLQQAMRDLQEELKDPNRKVLAYSNFIDAGLGPYEAALRKANIPASVFHGGLAASARRKALADYNAGRTRALLLGPAGAEGISTKGTNLIQILDPHWHDSRSRQAIGRGLRFDSHEDLPDELKDVKIRRYLTESKDPKWWQKALGYKRYRTADEILSQLASDKERLNEEFRQVLRDVGTKSAAMGYCRGVNQQEQKVMSQGIFKSAAPVVPPGRPAKPASPGGLPPQGGAMSPEDISANAFKAPRTLEPRMDVGNNSVRTLGGGLYSDPVSLPVEAPSHTMAATPSLSSRPEAMLNAKAPASYEHAPPPRLDLMSRLQAMIKAHPEWAYGLMGAGLGIPLAYGAYRGGRALMGGGKEDEKEASHTKQAATLEVMDGYLDTLAAKASGEKRAVIRRIQAEFAKSGNISLAIEKGAKCSAADAASRAIHLAGAIMPAVKALEKAAVKKK